MGGEAQVTVMVLKVDLGCLKCCRKIKKVLCSMPQIRNQLYDDKSNTVTVSALCCNPDKVADKIRRKAGGTVKGIDIKPSQPPPPAAKPPTEKPKESGPSLADKPKQGPPPPTAVKPQPQAAPPPHTADKPKSAGTQPAEKSKSAAPQSADKPKQDEKPKEAAAAPPPSEKGGSGPPPQKPKQQMPPSDDKSKKADNNGPTQQQQPQPQVPIITGPPPQGPPIMKQNQPAAFMSAESIPVAGYPSIFPPPMVYYDAGPYYQGQSQHGPVYQYDGYQGRPVGDYYGGMPYRSADYNYTEDNPSTCSVM